MFRRARGAVALGILTVCATLARAQEYGAETNPEEQIRQHLNTAKDKSRESYERSGALDNIGFMGVQGKSAIPELMPFLEDRDENIASSAQTALRQLLDDPREMLPLLTEALDCSAGTRTVLFVVEKLGTIGADAEALLPKLIPLLKHESPEVRAAAAQTIGNIGPGALGAAEGLIVLLGDDDSNVSVNASLALSMTMTKPDRIVPVLLTSLQNVANEPGRRYAAQQLQSAGKAAAPALAALTAVFANTNESRELRSVAAGALGSIGPGALSAADKLIDGLDDPSSDVSVSSSLALTMVTEQALPPIDVLIAAFQETDRPRGRVYAAQALSQLRAAAEPAVPALLGVFENHAETEELRSASANALGSIGPKAAPAVRELIRALGDSGSEINVSASLALTQIVQDAHGLFDVMVDALRDKSNVTGQTYAAQQLTGLKAKAAPALPDLLDALQNGAELRLKRAAANALGSIGPAAEPAVEPLLDTLNDDDSELRLNSDMALRAIISRPARLLPVFMEALKNPSNRPARVFCARQIVTVGPEARAAVPLLVDCLSDRDAPDLRAAAADALGAIGPDAEAGITPLIRALDDGALDAASAARMALSNIVTRPDKVLEPLFAAVKDKTNVPGRIWAAGQLGKVGAMATPAVPDLIDSITSPVPELRRVAAETLGYIGPTAQPAAPALFAVLDDVDAAVASLARSSLNRVVAKPVELLSLALPALKDETKPNTRLFAVETLGRIGPKARDATSSLVSMAGTAAGQLQESTLRALASIAPLKLVEAVKANAEWYDAHYVDWIAMPVATLGTTDQYAEMVEGLGSLVTSTAFDSAPSWVKALAYYDLGIGYFGQRDSQQGLEWFGKAVEQGFDDIASIHEQPMLRVLFGESRLKNAYGKIQVADADLFEVTWMLTEAVAVQHETSLIILENIGREDSDFTELPQVVVPTRPSKSPTVRALRQILRQRLDQQKNVVFLSDKSRIQHLSTMGIIANMGSISPSSAERAFRIQLSRQRALDNATKRRAQVAARQKRLAESSASTEPHPAPALGTYRR